MKILYVTTVSDTMGFFTPHIKMLLEEGHTVDMVCNIEKPIAQELLETGCKIYNIQFKRSPLKFNNYLAYKNLNKLIIEKKYDVVHTHTPIASSLVRLACKHKKKVKVMYTAHGFHFFKGAPLKNWLLYYPVEKWLSRYTDVLITINKEDYERANKSFKAKRVEYIPGVGLDTKKIREVVIDNIEKRKEIGIPQNAFAVLSVGELNSNKNHETVIRAIAKLKNPNINYIICGMGMLEGYLKKLAKDLGIEKQVHLLGFRRDIPEICKASDMFAFPSKREGLGLAALEAMSSGLPIITSNIHGIVDYSVNGVTGYTCSPMDVDGFAKAIKLLSDNRDITNSMGQINSSLVSKFDINNVKEIIDDIYARI